jgi:hypothetical protein
MALPNNGRFGAIAVKKSLSTIEARRRITPSANPPCGESKFLSCPGRGAAFFTLLRRAGTYLNACKVDPGSAAHHAAKGGALRSIRGTNS